MPASGDRLPPLPPGSQVRIQGVFKAATVTSDDLEQTVTSFDIYSNGPEDLEVLARPSWWTLGRLACVLLGVLTASAVVLAWGFMISRKNKLLHTAQAEMQVAHDRLERRVEERTQELASERDLFKSLVDNLPDLIYFKDTQSRFVRVSKAKLQESFRLAKVRHEAEQQNHDLNGTDALPGHLESLELFSAYLNGKTDFDLYPEDRARSAYEDEQEILRTGNPLVGKVERTALPNGSVSWLLTTKMLWRDPSGKVIGTFGTSKDITPLKEAEAKLEKLHQQLVEASRQAGMAEVATSVLHNVGNVLNSVNVAAAVILNLTRKSSGSQVAKLAALFEEHRHDLGVFLTQAGRVDQVIGFLKALDQHLASEQTAMLKELQELTGNIDHIKEIVSRQQSYAKVSGMQELQSVPALLEDALRMHTDSLTRHDVEVVRQFEPVPEVVVDKHKILQILVNLISNAKDALCDHHTGARRLTLRVGLQGENRVAISVADNGRGIEPENIMRIFSHGFTTKKDGHGFGLHSGAITATEMGGSLLVQSDGAGKGATFTLELPIQPATPA
jgi:C4-dicarboxylate-specific signal transduction histidine kinase